MEKPIAGWALYDWANSAFATTVMAGFFPIFFKSFWNSGVSTNVSTARLGIANSVAGLAVAMLAPVLGAIADRSRAKKKFLITFAALGILATFSLYFIAQGQWLSAMLVYITAAIGFSGANIFYDSLLQNITTPNRYDRVSALGYSLGYIGGGILFALNIWMVLSPATFGIGSKSIAVQIAFVSVAAWWAIFTVPLIIWVPEPGKRHPHRIVSAVTGGIKELFTTFRQIRTLKPVFLFLLAYWFYIDGVHTVIRMAVDYGISLGFESTDLIKALLITQFVGFPSAILFGHLGEKIGPKTAIYIGLTVYLGITIWGAFMTIKTEFYIMAAVIGLVQGGVQALSRSFYARLIPSDKSAEFFGFYNMMGKFAAILGPILMGCAGLLARDAGLSQTAASRFSIVSIASLFIVGGIILRSVHTKPHEL